MFRFIALIAPLVPQSEPNPLAMFLPMVLIFIVIYLFLIRPQKKKEDARQKMIAAVKKNDKVVTVGGLHGIVTQVDEHSVLIQVDQAVKVRVEKNALSSVAGKDKEKADARKKGSAKGVGVE